MADTQRVTRVQSRTAVLTFPVEIDITNTRRLGGELATALTSATTVIADMTATKFCDSSGVRILLLAYEQAVATGIEMRLVVSSGSVLRALALIGPDWPLPIYPSLRDALGKEPTDGPHD